MHWDRFKSCSTFLSQKAPCSSDSNCRLETSKRQFSSIQIGTLAHKPEALVKGSKPPRFMLLKLPISYFFWIFRSVRSLKLYSRTTLFVFLGSSYKHTTYTLYSCTESASPSDLFRRAKDDKKGHWQTMGVIGCSKPWHDGQWWGARWFLKKTG